MLGNKATRVRELVRYSELKAKTVLMLMATEERTVLTNEQHGNSPTEGTNKDAYILLSHNMEKFSFFCY